MPLIITKIRNCKTHHFASWYHTFTLDFKTISFQYKLTTVHWSPASKDLIVSGDEKGALVCWDLANNDSKLYIPETAHIFSLACSPHDAAHVAVG